MSEQELIKLLEDETDLEAYYARRNEETVSLEDVLADTGTAKCHNG